MNRTRKIVLPFDSARDREEAAEFVGSLNYTGIDFVASIEARGPIGGTDMVIELQP